MADEAETEKMLKAITADILNRTDGAGSDLDVATADDLDDTWLYVMGSLDVRALTNTVIREMQPLVERLRLAEATLEDMKVEEQCELGNMGWVPCSVTGCKNPHRHRLVSGKWIDGPNPTNREERRQS